MVARYQTSHGPLTLEEITTLPVDPMFYVMAGNVGSVRPNKRHTLQMDYPTSMEVKRGLEWLELSLNTGDKVVVPKYSEMLGLARGWLTRKLAPTLVLPGDLEDSPYQLMYLSRVRRNAKYCAIRHPLMPTGERIWEHRFVYEGWTREDIREYEVHHKDENPYNNCPENLEKMSRADHARHTGQHQRTRHNTRNLDGSFVAGGGPGRVATVPQKMPEYLKTFKVHQALKVTATKDLGQKDWPWLKLKFLDRGACYVVNSLFFAP